MPIQRFMNKVNQSDGCWEWQGSKWRGYGRVTVNGRQYKAHRFMWEHHNGPIPESMCVMHKCDNPGCVNPAHLFLGTQQDNMRDKVEKGRQNKGEKNGNAKLTEADIEAIKLYVQTARNKVLSKKSMAVRYDISITHVHRIISGQRWKG